MPRKKAGRSRGQILPEGEGKHRVRVFIGTDVEGKRQYQSTLVTGTISQAKRKLASMLNENDKGTLARPTGESIQVFAERVLNDVKKNSLGGATIRAYKGQVRYYIGPHLGKYKVEDVTAVLVQSWIGKLVDKGLSYGSIRLAHTVLSGIMEQAVTWNIVSKNPCANTELPKQLKVNKRNKPKKVFTADELQTFLTGVEGDPRYKRWLALVHVLLSCGLRPGEAGALAWPDVDLEAGVLTVRRAMEQAPTGTSWVIRESPKTEAGFRTIALPESTVEVLRKHRRSQAVERMAIGPDWKGQDLVFTLSNGGPVYPQNMNRLWRVLCSIAGVKYIPVYGARHTATTMELLAGVNPKTISKRRGHASVAFTLDQYAHVLDSMDVEAAQKVDHLFATSHPTRKVSNVD